MKVLIIGGGGVVGQKLGAALGAQGHLRGQEISEITLADIVDPKPVAAGCPVTTHTVDIADRTSVDALITADHDVIYLLAAIVSGHAEQDFDTGMNINLFGTHNVLERVRALGHKPVVVFSSSIAVYGGEVPDPIIDHTFLNPQTSYGMQKAMGELLINDYSRKGFLDGRAFRLPTISVRPGAANRAASSFMSSIIREPLNGKEAICPVDENFPHYYLSPRKCVENLIKGAELHAQDLGMNRAMMMPGRMWTIGQMIDAMNAVAGPGPAKLIKWEADETVQRIVNGWRFDLRPEKSLKLGLSADDSFADNVRYYMDDDLGKS
jgi:nucleoside-diphosphate-sugar epimerase